MEISRGLLFILGVLAIGTCQDVTAIAQGGTAAVLMGIVLAARIGAIIGIVQRSRAGWWIAIAFFAFVAILNVVSCALSSVGPAALLCIVIPLGCVFYLVALRFEFG